MDKSAVLGACKGLKMMHSLCVFDTLEVKFTPSKFVQCMELTL